MLYSGGGIAGLCLGVALARYPDIELNVYEAAATFKEVGAGVMMWGRVWRVLSLLGLANAFRELAGDTKDGDTSMPLHHSRGPAYKSHIRQSVRFPMTIAVPT